MIATLYGLFFSMIIGNKFIRSNEKVSVYIHINNLIPVLNIYHIGVSFKQNDEHLRYDIYDENLMQYLSLLLNNSNSNETTIFWGYSDKSIKEIYEYERILNYSYVLGFRDCRHYCNNLTVWSTGIGTPIWNLTNLL